MSQPTPSVLRTRPTCSCVSEISSGVALPIGGLYHLRGAQVCFGPSGCAILRARPKRFGTRSISPRRLTSAFRRELLREQANIYSCLFRTQIDMLHVHPVLWYMQLPAGLLRPQCSACSRVLIVLSAQPCNQAARAVLSACRARAPERPTGLDHHRQDPGTEQARSIGAGGLDLT